MMISFQRGFALLLALTAVLPLLVSAQPAPKPAQQAGTQPKPEDWYKSADRKSLVLRDMMLDADQGEVDAMIPLGLTLLSGWGRAEGAHPQAAIFWLNAAAERGQHKALEHLAVVYAIGEAVPRDEKRAAAYLDAHAAKTGKPIKAEECGDDDACSRFRRLVVVHATTILEYPRQARIDGLGGEFNATLDLAAKLATITGEKHLDLFGPPLKRATEDALRQIPMPAGLADRTKKLVLNFDLSVSK
jgi:hypothetical protein